MILGDISRIINADPRVTPLEITVNVDLDNHEVRADITIRLIEFDMNDSFTATFGEQV